MNRGGRSRSAGERRAKRQAALEPGAAIRALTPDAKDPSLVHVRIGRRSAAKIHSDAATRLGLKAGTVLDAHLVAEVVREQGVTDARYWALRAIARAPISTGMLEAKLRRKGVDVAAAKGVIADLTGRGWLDDRAYAEGVVASELRRKPAGARLLDAKLRSKRIDGRIAAEVVRSALGERESRGIDEAEEAMLLAERKARSLTGRQGGRGVEPDVVVRRVYAMLARRGFDPETCGKVARRVVKAADANEM